ncbi:nuclear transport factor 2 family protein [Nocardioides immobilis]|uniref:Nuclear transport factor 2 family protein n=1 Tax=Nocardioides immobilis TaxID=2049295 RepID=A0A417XW82_9ACTN|nr:nuclear transport factor 2 family protein [Nocardioides immobilis]
MSTRGTTVPDPFSADRWAIQDLKHRYVRSVDLRDWEALAATLAPEMAAQYRPDLVTEGADALVAELRGRLTEHRITIHQLAHPSIEIDGHRATGTWTMTDRTICTDIGVVVEGMSVSHDRYRRDPERGWLITSIGYQRAYEATMALTDVPSFVVRATPYDLVAPA